MNIYLDFDGTVVEHDYPLIGTLNPHSLEVVKKLQEAGHNLILNTMRVEFDDDSMQQALDFLNQNELVKGISIVQHTNWKIHPPRWNPEQIQDEIYIDDIAADIPLIEAFDVEGLMVDWLTVEKQLVERGVLERQE